VASEHSITIQVARFSRNGLSPRIQDKMLEQRRPFKFFLIILSLLVFSPPAHAQDVEIAYAVRVEGKVDKGKVERCRVGEQCRIVSKDTGLTIFIYPGERSTLTSMCGVTSAVVISRTATILPRSTCTSRCIDSISIKGGVARGMKLS
jgi:hypothetical protein